MRPIIGSLHNRALVPSQVVRLTGHPIEVINSTSIHPAPSVINRKIHANPDPERRVALAEGKA